MTPITCSRLVLISMLILLLCGCGVGNRLIFSSSGQLLITPDQQGLIYQEVWFAADDGTRLHGWFIPGAAGRPLVLFFHGNAANISHRVDNLVYLHNLGLPVFIFDYRGFGHSEGVPRSEEDLWQDARGALAWLAGQGWLPERMIYFGRSMGAAIAIQMALERAPAGLILEAPFTSLADIAKHLTPITYALFGWWSVDASFDNSGRLGGISTPLLIMHGTRDAVVPPEMSRRLFACAPEPKTLLFIEEAGHSDAYAVSADVYRQAWLRFIAALSYPTP